MKQPAYVSAQKRQFERFSFEVPGIAICDTGFQLPCSTLDLSIAGARLRLIHPIRNYPGHTVEKLELRGIGPMFINVRWIQDKDLGVRFDHTTQTRERMTSLLALLESRRKSATAPKSSVRKVG
jgi:hypothetical protein